MSRAPMLSVLGSPATDGRYLLIQDFHTGDDRCGCLLRKSGGACEPGQPAVSRVRASEAKAFILERQAVLPRPWGNRETYV